MGERWRNLLLNRAAHCSHQVGMPSREKKKLTQGGSEKRREVRVELPVAGAVPVLRGSKMRCEFGVMSNF